MAGRYFDYDTTLGISGSALRLRALLDPDDPALTTFDCGDSEPAVSINAYIRSARWFAARNHVGMAFVTEAGQTAGVAVVRTRLEAHPAADAPDRARYLMLLAFGVNREFQGQPDRGSPDRRLSDSMVRVVLGLSIRNYLVGVSLRVRDTNIPARRLYERNGFTTDADIARVDSEGVSFLGMRHLNAEAYALSCAVPD